MPVAQPERSAPNRPPRSLHPVIYLLFANLAMSLLLTILVFLFRNSVINFQAAHAHIREGANLTRQEQLDLARTSAQIGIWSRVAGNVIVAVVYWFLVRSLLAGKRRAYIRVLWLSVAGIVSLAFLWITPYPTWIRVEQVLQSFILVGILYRVTRPEVRAYFAKRPRESKRRFGRSQG
jgi:uncharacterized membrane protein